MERLSTEDVQVIFNLIDKVLDKGENYELNQSIIKKNKN